MLVLRKIIFYIFTLLYLVFCPILILYALGYTFKPYAKERIVETGTIYLSTVPSGASLYVNGKASDQITPAALEKLLPGKYHIAISQEKYNIWKEVLPVTAGKATVLDKIILIPEVWEKEILLEDTFINILSLREAPFFILTKGKTLGDYRIYDYKGNKTHRITKEGSKYDGYNVLSYFNARKSSSVLLCLSSNKERRFLLVVLDGSEVILEDVTDLFPGDPEEIIWCASDEDNLFSFRDGNVNRVNVKTKAVYPNYLRSIRGMGLLEKKLYVLSEKRLESMDYEKNDVETILDDPGIISSVFGGSGYFRIIPFTDNLILFEGKKGELLANRLPYRFINEGVKGIDLDMDEKKALVWQEDRIAILDFSSEITGNVLFEKGPELDWVFSDGKGIGKASWVHNGSHILFSQKNDVFLLELEGYVKPHPTHVLRIKEKSSFVYCEETGLLYCLEPLKGRLISVEIVKQ